jgi:hypothetical protein
VNLEVNKMKKLPIIFIVLLFALPGWGATYYVSTSGTAKGATACATFLAMAANQSTPAKTVADMNTCAASLSDGDIIAFKRGETWAENLMVNHSALTFTNYGTGDLPVFTGNANYSFTVNAGYANQIFDGLWFRTRGGIVIDTTGAIFRRNIMSDVSNASTYGIDWYAPGTIDNNLFLGPHGYAIYVRGSAAAPNIRNNMFLGGAAARIYRAGGTCRYSNNLFWGHNGSSYIESSSGTPIVYSCTDDGGNIGISATGYATESAGYPDPKFILAHYPDPLVVVCVDDNPYIDYAVSLAEAIAPYGARVSYAFYPYDQTITAATITKLQNLYDAGNEIVLHAGSHTKLTSTNAFAITTTNSGDNAIVISDATSTLTLTSSGNPENNVSVDWSGGAKTICDLKVAIGCTGSCTSGTQPADPCTGTKGWTIDNATDVSGWLHLSSLQDASKTIPYTTVVDAGTATNRFYRDELDYSKTALEAILGGGRTVSTIAYPQGGMNQTIAAYMSTLGTFKAGRAVNSSVENNVGGYIIANNLYYLNALSVLAFKGAGDTEDEARANARWQYGRAKHAGAIITLLSHGELSVSRVAAIVAELYAHGATMVTLDGLADYIISNGTNFETSSCTSNGQPWYCCTGTGAGYCSGVQYLRTFAQGDYHLRAGSPAINAGVDVGLTTDADGKPISGKPDIGAYEYQPTATGSGLLMCQ